MEEKSSLNIPGDNSTPLMDSSNGSQDKKSKDNDRREAKGSPFSYFDLPLLAASSEVWTRSFLVDTIVFKIIAYMISLF